jgi:signal transduction histidine kinase
MSDVAKEIQFLRERIAELEQDKKDLETMLEMTTAHSDTVEEDLLLRAEKLKTQQEIDRRRTLSQMVAGVAHEINTPLGIANHAASIISELARDLTKAPGQEANRETLDDILSASRMMQQNIARAAHLVQTFKTLSVSQAIDKLERTHLRKVTQDTVDLYRLKARSSHLVVSLVDRLGENGDEWEGYPGHYSQILLNLLTNIDRYAYPDGAGGKVEIELRPVGQAGRKDGYTVVVRDFGRGIAPDDLDHVFEPFFTTGRGRGGTGLGLPIVRNLVTESLNGEISISSRLGEGTEVLLTLPRIVVPPAEARKT